MRTAHAVVMLKIASLLNQFFIYLSAHLSRLKASRLKLKWPISCKFYAVHVSIRMSNGPQCGIVDRIQMYAQIRIGSNNKIA